MWKKKTIIFFRCFKIKAEEALKTHARSKKKENKTVTFRQFQCRCYVMMFFVCVYNFLAFSFHQPVFHYFYMFIICSFLFFCRFRTTQIKLFLSYAEDGMSIGRVTNIPKRTVH